MSHADVCMAKIISDGPEGPGTHNKKRGLGVFLKRTLSALHVSLCTMHNLTSCRSWRTCSRSLSAP